MLISMSTHIHAYKVRQFNSQNVPMKAKFPYLRVLSFMMLCNLQKDCAIAGKILGTHLPKYLSVVTLLDVGKSLSFHCILQFLKKAKNHKKMSGV